MPGLPVPPRSAAPENSPVKVQKARSAPENCVRHLKYLMHPTELTFGRDRS